MGEKRMRFDNMEGDILCVTFRGTGVQAGEVSAASQPVVIQMDGGGGEYAAVKYATASVSMLTTGVQHLDLYTASPLAVAVDIVNETTGEVLFAGYVTPNTFGQPIDGVNDTLTIECVDYLGIAKFVPMAVPLGAVMTLEEVFAHISAKLGASGLRATNTVRLVSGDGATETSEYWKLTIAGRCFYDSTTPSATGAESVSMLPESMTVYEALEMIAESLRLTWVQRGGELVLFDDVAARYGMNPFGEAIELTEESIAESGSQISVIPRVSMVSLARKSDNEVGLLQPMFDDGLLYPNGDAQRYRDNANQEDETVTISQPLSSRVYECGDNASFLSFAELTRPKNRAFSEAWSVGAWGDEHSWTNCLRIAANDSALTVKAVERVAAFSTSFPERAAAGLRLKITAGFTRDTSRLYPYKLLTSGDCRFLMSLSMTKNGVTQYYNEYAEQWQPERRIMSLYFDSDLNSGAEWRSTFVTLMLDGLEFPKIYPLSDVLTPSVPGGTLNFELYSPSSSNLGWSACYIKEFDLSAVVTPAIRAANALDAPAEVGYLGTYDYLNAADTVTLPIDVRTPLGSKMFGTVIDGQELLQSREASTQLHTSKRWEVGVEYDDGAGGRMSMLQRIERQRNPGDGMEYAITLVDAHNAGVSPMTAASCRAWTGRKVVAAYTRDLAESKINVTLN